jgi:hypothetical protein
MGWLSTKRRAKKWPPSEDEEKPKHLPSKLVMTVVDDKKRKRITVPLAQQLPLTRQAHETLLHQKGQRVFHDLERENFWTNMEMDTPLLPRQCCGI